MAETQISVQGYLETPTYVAATAEMKFVNDGRTQLGVLIDADTTVTHIEQNVCEFGHVLTDRVDAILSPGRFFFYYGNQIRRWTGADGMMHVAFSNITDVSVYAYTNARK